MARKAAAKTVSTEGLDALAEATGMSPEELATELENAERMRDIVLPVIEMGKITAGVKGITRLMTNQFGHGTLKGLRDKAEGKTMDTRAPVNPEEKFQQSRYLLEMPGETKKDKSVLKDVIPAIWFKKAMLSALPLVGRKTISYQLLMMTFFVTGDATEEYSFLRAEEPVHDIRVVRVGPQKVPDVRHRAAYPAGWQARVYIEYNAKVLRPEFLYALLQQGGFHGGFGEMRPQKTGYSWGRFALDTTADSW